MTEHEKTIFESGYYAGYMVAEKEKLHEPLSYWIYNSRADAPQCSHCKCTLDNRTPFCPMCGHRMDFSVYMEPEKVRW